MSLSTEKNATSHNKGKREMALHTDILIQKNNKRNYMNNKILLFVVAASLGCVNAVAEIGRAHV